MKYLNICLTVLCLLASCKPNNDGAFHQTQRYHKKANNDTIKEVAMWADYFIVDYLNSSSGNILQLNDSPITYIKDLVVEGGTSYARAQIGFNYDHRFVVTKSIFIDSITKEIYEYDTLSDSLSLWSKYSQIDSDKDIIPPSGIYLFDVEFSEWNRMSMGVQLTVIIKNDSARIVYEGHGSLSVDIGDVVDEGIIMKHISGKWIIGRSEKDIRLEEIGGCTGGPSIINFKSKKYQMC